MRVPRWMTALVLSGAFGWAVDVPLEGADVPPDTIGSPSKVVVEPGRSTLVGARATRQLIASATDLDGSTRDLTRLLAWTSLNPEVATVDVRGQVDAGGQRQGHPRGSKGGSVEASAVGRGLGAGVGVKPVSFRNDVVPSLSQAGCNMGACHGTPDRQGRLPAQPPGLPARPGLHRP